MWVTQLVFELKPLYKVKLGMFLTCCTVAMVTLACERRLISGCCFTPPKSNGVKRQPEIRLCSQAMVTHYVEKLVTTCSLIFMLVLVSLLSYQLIKSCSINPSKCTCQIVPVKLIIGNIGSLYSFIHFAIQPAPHTQGLLVGFSCDVVNILMMRPDRRGFTQEND